MSKPVTKGFAVARDNHGQRNPTPNDFHESKSDADADCLDRLTTDRGGWSVFEAELIGNVFYGEVNLGTPLDQIERA